MAHAVKDDLGGPGDVLLGDVVVGAGPDPMRADQTQAHTLGLTLREWEKQQAKHEG